jgi:hypothetical protein
MVSNWLYSCLAALVFCGVTVNLLPGSAMMVSSCQMLRRGRSPTVALELVSRKWLKYIHLLRCVVGKSRFEYCNCMLEYLFRPCDNIE